MPDYRAMTRQAATRAGIDPNVFERQIGAESNFDPNVSSGAGAVGIAQFMPGTARGLGINPNNPQQALNAAAKLMAGYIKQYGGWENALRAYNAGPGRIQASHGFAETNSYVDKILRGATPAASTSPSPTSPSPSSGPRSSASYVSQPGKSNAGARYALVRSFLDDPKASTPQFLSQFSQLKDQPAQTRTITSTATGSPPTDSQSVMSAAGVHGSLPFDNTQVAAWIQPVLKYARQHGWSGSVTSGYRSVAEQTKLYQDMLAGRRAGPVGKPGQSNHNFTAFPGGAVDVSNPAQLSAILMRSKYANLLVWAGAKDQWHFSHPHNGGY